MQDSTIGLVVLCGLPGAGKSKLATLISELLITEKINDCTCHVNLFCYDELISEDLDLDVNSADAQTWKDYRNDIFELVKTCISCVQQNMAQSFWDHSFSPNHDVNRIKRHLCDCFFPDKDRNLSCEMNEKTYHVFIIDDNMFYRSMRYAYYQLAREYIAGFCQVFLKCDRSLAWERNLMRKEKVTLDSFSRVSSKFEEPNKTSFPWENASIEVNSNYEITGAVLENVWKFIVDSINRPVQPFDTDSEKDKKAAQLITSSNIIHQVDIIIRSFISHSIREKQVHLEDEKNKGIKEVAFVLNKQRRAFLEDIRTKEELRNEVINIIQRDTCNYAQCAATDSRTAVDKYDKTSCKKKILEMFERYF